MSRRYTDWRDMPGPGDEETWGPCQNHPNDPRTPDAEDEEEDEEDDGHPEIW